MCPQKEKCQSEARIPRLQGVSEEFRREVVSDKRVAEKVNLSAPFTFMYY